MGVVQYSLIQSCPKTLARQLINKSIFLNKSFPFSQILASQLLWPCDNPGGKNFNSWKVFPHSPAICQSWSLFTGILSNFLISLVSTCLFGVLCAVVTSCLLLFFNFFQLFWSCLLSPESAVTCGKCSHCRPFVGVFLFIVYPTHECLPLKTWPIHRNAHPLSQEVTKSKKMSEYFPDLHSTPLWYWIRMTIQ